MEKAYIPSINEREVNEFRYIMALKGEYKAKLTASGIFDDKPVLTPDQQVKIFAILDTISPNFSNYLKA